MNRDSTPPELLPDTCRLMDRAEAITDARTLAGQCYQDQGVAMPGAVLDQAQQDLTKPPLSPASVSAVPSRKSRKEGLSLPVNLTWGELLLGGGCSAAILLGIILITSPAIPSGPSVLTSPLPPVTPTLVSPNEASPKLFHPLVLAGAEDVTKPSPAQKRNASEQKDSSGGLIDLIVCVSFFLAMPIIGLILSSGRSPSPSTPYAQEVTNVRWMAAMLSTDDLTQLAKGQQPSDVSSNERDGVTPEDYHALEKLGALTIIDHEGRPEIQWQHVSSGVCHALVTDIYKDASTHGVAVTVDGKNAGVSCAGPTHDIVLTPHL